MFLDASTLFELWQRVDGTGAKIAGVFVLLLALMGKLGVFEEGDRTP